MLIPTLLILSLLFATSSASVHDFCVADLSQSDTPLGFPCKDPKKITADDFAFSGLGEPGNTTNPINAYVTPAFTPQFPAVNGLWISMAIPMHTHPGGTEMLYLIKGTTCVGFISYDNTLYAKTIKEGDTFLFPQGLEHFIKNCGTKPVFGITSFSSSMPGMQLLELMYQRKWCLGQLYWIQHKLRNSRVFLVGLVKVAFGFQVLDLLSSCCRLFVVVPSI
ncbi:unnamed protein product [Lactuca saligna]|uniref:Germin-like protein n=1 Tax=Lactuca saligna TaxID=75948 RepID=A0AA35Y612_LACSI|nr:unnamed protein product [Lactuca saligna]